MSTIVEETGIFTKFPEIPIELQIQTLEAALPYEPRLVALWLKT
jgi:hypothetical protein